MGGDAEEYGYFLETEDSREDFCIIFGEDLRDKPDL